MRSFLFVAVFSLCCTTVAWAEKPANPGKSKQAEHAAELKKGKAERLEELDEREHQEQYRDRAEQEAKNPVKGDKPGLEKQRQKKAEQEQKELDKGSEQGQESRSQRKKWWRFWE